MYKTTATKMFANANRDNNETIARIKRQKVQLATAKEAMLPFINVMRSLLKDSDHMSISNGYEKPSIYMHVRGLDSFKSAQLKVQKIGHHQLTVTIIMIWESIRFASALM